MGEAAKSAEKGHFSTHRDKVVVRPQSDFRWQQIVLSSQVVDSGRRIAQSGPFQIFGLAVHHGTRTTT